MIRITAPTDTLRSTLELLLHFAASKDTTPALTGILLQSAQEGPLTLMASDLDSGARLQLLGAVTGTGEVLLPARALVDLLRRIPTGEVTLSATPEALEVFYDRSRVRLPLLSGYSFPQLPWESEGELLEMDGSLFHTMVEEVAFAADRGEDRPDLAGIRLQVSSDSLEMMATDSLRLSYRKIASSRSLDGEHTLMLPLRPVRELGRALNGEPRVLFSLSPAMLTATVPATGRHFFVRLFEGRIPDVHRLMPTAFPWRYRFATEKMSQVLRQALVIADAESRLVRLEWREDRLQISSASDRGQAVLDVPASVEGEPQPLAFNAQFLLDALNAYDAEESELAVSGTTSPALLRPWQDATRFMVVMPLVDHG